MHLRLCISCCLLEMFPKLVRMYLHECVKDNAIFKTNWIDSLLKCNPERHAYFVNYASFHNLFRNEFLHSKPRHLFVNSQTIHTHILLPFPPFFFLFMGINFSISQFLCNQSFFIKRFAQCYQEHFIAVLLSPFSFYN